jgi:hypothetical protein
VYRKAARRLHTDLSGTSLTNDAFIAMQAAYEQLTAPGAAGVFVDSPVEAVTVEGTPVADLGKGLGRKNGMECKNCKGAGYLVRKRRKIVWWPYEPCDLCRIMGSVWGCRTCAHLTFRHNDIIETIYGTCVECQGHGETEIINPVLPKGFLALPAGMGQKARKRAGLR